MQHPSPDPSNTPQNTPRKGIGSHVPGKTPFSELTPPATPQAEIDYGDGRIAILRSFEADITGRVEALADRFEVNTVGTATYGPHTYPIYQIVAVGNPDNPWIHLSGIVHGDEEAGGKTILYFHESGKIEDYLEHFNFISYPCVNGSGYETATLQAMNGYHPELRAEKNTGNINRSMGGALPQQEARILEEALRNGPERYLVAIDMHESPPYYWDEVYTPDDAPKGFWLYETCREESLRIGTEMTESLPPHLPACEWDTIYSDSADEGVIAFAEDTTQHAEYVEPTSVDGHLFAHYTDHSFTFETPTGWKLENRIEAQLHFLQTVLEIYIERNLR
jgi:hypothetical protein